MTAAWGVKLAAGDKLVLLALADCANDDGLCWPGMKNLVGKTGKCERSVQAAIKSLEKHGHLTRDEKPGKGCYYTVHPRNNCAPVETAPPQKLTPTPAKTAGKPSVTINSPMIANAITPPADVAVEDGKTLKPEHVLEAWNDLADRTGLPKAKKLTPERRRKLITRIRQNSIEEFTEAIGTIERSPFLRGENGRGWRADFDWMLEPRNFTKLTEGSYER